MSIITPEMGLVLPVVGETTDLAASEMLVVALETVSEHDHSDGNGATIKISNVEIDSNVDLDGKQLLNPAFIQFYNNLAAVTGIGKIYELNGNLYFNDNEGNTIQLTAGGTINVSSVGSITGFGTGIDASVVYSDLLKTFTFFKDAGLSAKLVTGGIQVRNTTNGINILPQDDTDADYTIYLPLETPAENQLIRFNADNEMVCIDLLGTTNQIKVTQNADNITLSLPVAVTTTTVNAQNGYGIVPLGSVIPIASNLTGSKAIPASGVVTSDGWMLCDGTAIPSGNTLSGSVPNLTDNRFLMGSSASGTTGGANSKTLSTSEMPTHSHTNSVGNQSADHQHSISHDHSNGTTSSDSHSHNTVANGYNVPCTSGSGTYSNNWVGSAGASQVPITSSWTYQNTTGSYAHTHTLDIPAYSGNSGNNTANHNHTVTINNNGSSTAFDIRPQYVTCQYIIRVR